MNLKKTWLVVMGGALLATACQHEALPAQQEQQPLVGCTDRAIDSLEGTALVRIARDGTRTERYRFGVGATIPVENIYVSSWQRVGAYQAAVATLYDPKQVGGYTYEFVILDDRGVVFSHNKTLPYNPEIFLGENGSLAVSSGGSGWIRQPNGAIVDLGQYLPMGPMLASDVLPVQLGPLGEGTPPRGLLRVPSMKFEAFADTVGYQLIATPKQFLFLSTNADSTAAQLVAVRAHETIRLSVDPASSQIAGSSDRYVLLLDQNRQLDLRLVDLQERSVTAIPGTRATSGYDGYSATVDETGRVFVSHRQDDRLVMRRTDDRGATFVEVGTAMEPGPDLGFAPWLAPIAHQGNALVLNLSTGYGNMLNSLQFTADQTRTVVAGGGYYLNYPWAPGQFDLSLDGQCAAAWVLTEGEPFGAETQFSLVLIDQDGPQTITTAAQYSTLRF